MLDTLTITPPTARLIMCCAASRAHRNTPVRFTSMTACHCASVILPTTRPSFTFTSSASRTMPALLMRPSRRPKSAVTWSRAPHPAVLIGSIGDVAACRRTRLPAAHATVSHLLAVGVQQGKIGALAGEVQGEGAADAASRSGHENGFAANIHTG